VRSRSAAAEERSKFIENSSPCALIRTVVRLPQGPLLCGRRTQQVLRKKLAVLLAAVMMLGVMSVSPAMAAAGTIVASPAVTKPTIVWITTKVEGTTI
jgi:hypothetical protein